MDKIIVGSEEWCTLPELGLPAIKARIDSGAKTSSLHAFNIEPFEENGKYWVKFSIHPIQNNRKIVKHCQAEVIDRRTVKSSSGSVEKRYVILTRMSLGNITWNVEVTLTNRDSMGYRMLIGRQAMEDRVLVDPSKAFCLDLIDEEKAKELYGEPSIKKRGLRIIVLASNKDLYSNKRLMEAGEVRGHEMIFVNTKYCWVNVNATKPVVHYRGGEILKNIDGVIPRLKPSMTFYGCSVLRHFEASNAFCLNRAQSIARARDKLRSLQLLAERGIDMPITGFAHSPQDTTNLIKMVGGAPLVIKLLEGTQGVGVVLAETSKAAESVINAFKSLKANILVQEFIKEAKGRDIRCFVIDGKVVGAMEREAAEGEFRANLHLGGTAHPVKLTQEERKMAVAAAKAIGLEVAGVDIIRSKNGPKILEVNASPGLEGIERVTGKDIAGLMIESVEKSVFGAKARSLAKVPRGT